MTLGGRFALVYREVDWSVGSVFYPAVSRTKCGNVGSREIRRQEASEAEYSNNYMRYRLERLLQCMVYG